MGLWLAIFALPIALLIFFGLKNSLNAGGKFWRGLLLGRENAPGPC